jgi:hypothetical protein
MRPRKHASKQATAPKSSSPAHCKRKLNEEKVKRCQFDSANSFWPCIFPQDACTGKRQSLTTAVDWLDSSIGPGGLLLVVSYLLAVPVLVLLVVLERSK